MPQGISVTSFEDVYKTAYSHGLEAIYALEDVDIKSVRRLSAPICEQPSQVTRKEQYPEDPQMLLDFGPAFVPAMEHFSLREPIQVLSLSKYLENHLLAQGRRQLKDLVGWHPPGLGQGHIDEIRHKLKSYLPKDGGEKSTLVDYGAWLRSMTGDLERKKLYVCLEPYNLHHLVVAAPADQLELRRLTLEKRQEWQEEGSVFLKAATKKQQIDADLREITERFIKPWMDCRHGLASIVELEERLLQISAAEEDVPSIVGFIRDYYFKGAFPLNRYLEPLDAPIFASAPHHADRYDAVVDQAYSYFCRPDATYRLSELSVYMEREFARRWIGFRDGFIERALKLCPHFQLYKSEEGILRIALA